MERHVQGLEPHGGTVPDGGGKLEHVEVLEDVGDGHQTQDTQEPQACVHKEGS